MVREDLLQFPKAAMKVMDEAKTKKGQGQKFISPELHETHQSEIKQFPYTNHSRGLNL